MPSVVRKTFPIQPLFPRKWATLRTVTNNEIKLYGYKWVYMHNVRWTRIVIPFYVCDVHQPIVSVQDWKNKALS